MLLGGGDRGKNGLRRTITVGALQGVDETHGGLQGVLAQVIVNRGLAACIGPFTGDDRLGLHPRAADLVRPCTRLRRLLKY